MSTTNFAEVFEILTDASKEAVADTTKRLRAKNTFERVIPHLVFLAFRDAMREMAKKQGEQISCHYWNSVARGYRENIPFVDKHVEQKLLNMLKGKEEVFKTLVEQKLNALS